MLDLLWRYRKPVLLALLVGLIIYITVVQDKDEDDYYPWDHVIVKVMAPIQKGIDWLLDGTSGFIERYIGNRDAAADNEALRRQLAELRRKSKDIDEVRRENHRLLGLLNLIDRSTDVQYLPARVIANATSSQFRSVRIDRGAADGVVRGMGVVAEAGLVGRVMAVEEHYADVMLLSDTQSSIGIVVGRSRARGQLRGQGDAAGVRARIDYLGRSSAVELGDEVLTTGAGRVFPKGLRVGFIRSVNKTEHGLYQEAIVESAAPLFALDEVAVVLGFGPEALIEPLPPNVRIEPPKPGENEETLAEAPMLEPDAAAATGPTTPRGPTRDAASGDGNGPSSDEAASAPASEPAPEDATAPATPDEPADTP